eukprot:948278_1
MDAGTFTTVNQSLQSMFTIQKHLGGGGYGEVYRAVDRNNGSVVALKHITGSRYKPNEFKLLKSCNSRYIIKTMGVHARDVVLAQSWPNPLLVDVYLVLEYCAGGSTEQWEGKCDSKTLQKVAFDVLSGLSYLHAKDIIHRDVKPSNILHHASGIFKLADFGHSKDVKHSLAKSWDVGTPLFIAPEIGKDISYDNKVDIWSFGKTMQRLAADEIPYGLDTKCLMEQPEQRPSAESLLGMINDMKKDTVDRKLFEETKNRMKELEQQLRMHKMNVNYKKNEDYPMYRYYDGRVPKTMEFVMFNDSDHRTDDGGIIHGGSGIIHGGKKLFADENGFVRTAQDLIKGTCAGNALISFCGDHKGLRLTKYYRMNLDITMEELFVSVGASTSDHLYMGFGRLCFAVDYVDTMSDEERSKWNIVKLSMYDFNHDVTGIFDDVIFTKTLREYLVALNNSLRVDLFEWGELRYPFDITIIH